MKLADLRNLPPNLASVITDAKEALVDVLLNRTWQRCSGLGNEGNFVYGVKPSQRFVSGFLLPRFDEFGDQDEHLTSTSALMDSIFRCCLAQAAL